jgi:hypothetical protein
VKQIASSPELSSINCRLLQKSAALWQTFNATIKPFQNFPFIQYIKATALKGEDDRQTWRKSQHSRATERLDGLSCSAYGMMLVA